MGGAYPTAFVERFARTSDILDNMESRSADGNSWAARAGWRQPSSRRKLVVSANWWSARCARRWWSANSRSKPGIRPWLEVTRRWQMPSWIAWFNTRIDCHSPVRRCVDASHHLRRTTPLRNDSPTSSEQRVCVACGRHFAARGRKAYCSAACRERGFRLRRRPADELQLGFAHRLPKTAIVYQRPRAMHACSVNSVAKSAASLPDGSDPVDRAHTATRWSLSMTSSLSFAPLRLPQGGDQPNLTTIDNDIASHGIAATPSVRHHRQTTVRFAPN
jgi:hypothetical protein